MSNHRKCCCGCNSIYRVFEPCGETPVSVDVRRAVATVAALDSAFGTAAWEGVTYLYNGQCGCDAYCGTWKCDARANVVDEDGDPLNICTAVPCDSPVAPGGYGACPECTDTDLPFINVRISDILPRFTVIENPVTADADCCDPRCPNDCQGDIIRPSDGNCGDWVGDDFIWHTPVITGPSNIIMNGVDGQVMNYSVGGATLVDTYQDSPSSTYRYWLLNLQYSWTMDISGMSPGGLCTDESPPQTTGSGNFHYSVYQSTCGVSNTENCLATDGTGGFMAVTSTITYNDPFEWPPGSGNFYENRDDSYVCWTNRGFGNERFEFWHPNLGSNSSNVPDDMECARFGTKVSTFQSFRLKSPFPNGYPFFLDGAEAAKLLLPENLFEVELSVTYPQEFNS